MVEKGLELRVLGPRDAAALAALEARVFDDAWNFEQFRDLLGQDRFLAVGAFDPAGLCAYLTAYSVAGELEIVNVAVTVAQRGKGIGRSLLLFFLEQGRLRGAERAVLEVRSGNAAARALYGGCGFVQVGMRRAYYADSGEDALVLEWTPCPGS
ncbi:MAG: ribosomal-protein-alanine N-acetyltransferase [Deltaproteobacteria bacterium HGW-Deltaproteobacteria-18]|jgi:ribosomal-protein-alanine N-acetyltransferase|nr:MAG: ribosomal-protein-alanine N-acetyltransferase [Deltaproteobacteria bacterium HGW-Deltaproteobacteria-18]